MKPRSILIGLLLLLVLGACSPVAAQVSFSDNFNRPDGLVGNGWSSWWDGQFDHPNTSLVNGELRTFGFINQAGGIFRSLPVGFPLSFSFNFRTASQFFQCGSGSFNDGGWLISFNEPASSLPPNSGTVTGPAQFMLIHFSGQRNLVRAFGTAAAWCSIFQSWRGQSTANEITELP